MLVPGSTNPLLLFPSAAAGGYQISRSLRFNSADSAYLSRTPASAGNRKTWTWSGWLKRGALSATEAESTLFSGGGGADDSTIVFTGNQLFYYYYASPGGYLADVRSIAVFRDLSAWYHIVVAVDTTQATASNRVRLYVNGSEVSYSSPTYPSLSLDMGINTVSTVHTVGVRNTLFNYLSGYLADIHFIDGQALTPSSFTEVSATTGQLIPKAYTGSFGTNGFHLDFADNSAATAAALGKDTSGNGNNWTPNNLSVTAGAGNDSLVDVPVNGAQTDTGVGGEVRGNYCTWNPLAKLSTLTTLDGNLKAVATGTSEKVLGSICVQSGKWYWEVTPETGVDNNVWMIGVAKSTSTLSNYPGGDTDSWGYYASNGNKYNNGSAVAYGATYAAGNVIGVALDLDAGTLAFYKNGVSQGTAYTGLASSLYSPAFGYRGTVYANFGQRPFAYTAPSGFKALCTANLPAPLVTKPSTVMDAVLYTGTGSTLTPTSSLGFSPDLVWIKGRSGATDHALYDTVRGAQARLESNTTDAEVTTDGGVTAFNSNGFTLGTLAQVNTNTATYAAWCWDAGSSNVVNTQGSITSSVRANATAGFSIVSYTSVGTSGTIDTVGHGLGVSPSMFIVKNRDVADSFYVARTDFSNPTRDYLQLNSTAAKGTIGADAWSFSSTTVGIRQATIGTASGQKIIVYCFAPVAGYSSFGSYTGNGSADGPFVYTNVLPRWVMIKRTDSTSNWTIIDTAREGYNVDNDPLYPNLSDAEGTADLADILSNGFKLRTTDASVNASAGTYIYACFGANPFAYSRSR